MSIKDKLLAKTGDLTLPAAAPSPSAPDPAALPPAATPEASRFPPALPAAGATAVATTAAPTLAPRTGPGQMLQFRGQLLAVEGEMGKLRERLKEHEGALPTRKLDAALVLPSRWANRHADAFASADFMSLKRDIELAGGNVQPILVRPLVEPGAPAGAGGRYELVFGHRRHRACADLGLPVLAVIDNGAMSDLDLFAAMDRENRERADLSPYEQGLMYRRALDEKLYPSNRRLAEALGVSHTWVANVLAVADLPQPLLDCFRSPLDVQHRHAKQLMAALEQDRKGVLKRAEKLRQQGRGLAPAAVVEALLGVERGERQAKAGDAGVLRLDGRIVGRWSFDGAGALQLQLDAGVVAPSDAGRIAQVIAQTLAAERTAGRS
ncbi:MAG: ParB/RepB/Spo0J family partition protein [Burkholderiaceae bacterium]|nr:ParB/RepB/Spo0J family partition protein [Burkholderiaceae bacterium]